MKIVSLIALFLILLSSSALAAYVIGSQSSAVQCIAYSGSGFCPGVFDGRFATADAYDSSWYCNSPECSAGGNWWAKVDLGTNRCIRQVMITAPADGGGTDYLRMFKAIKLQYSTDNTSFTSLNTFDTTQPTKKNDNSTYTNTSNNINARYWRIIGDSTHNAGGLLPLGMAEISLYYDDTNPNCGGISVPSVTAINCTSCNVPLGDNTEPFTTSDTTPTFNITTDIASNCRIGANNVNYSTMGSSRECSNQEAFSHICTLTTQDELATSAPTIYVGCSGTDGAETVSNSSAKLLMDIANLTTTITEALDQGIQRSTVWPGATIYSNQQVYLRNLANIQVVGTADRVVVSGSQRWIFNVGSDAEAALGLFNITPAVYSLELINQSSSNIQSKVSALINTTKR